MSAAKRSGAYSIRRHTPCQWSGCKRSATWDVFNRFNALLGHYCAKHEKSRLNQSDLEFVPTPGIRAAARGEEEGE